jgi:hypothetical protein
MPIRPFLDGHRFDPETLRVMGIAFEMARAALRVASRDDLPNEQLIANRIIDLAKAGERDANLLCEAALLELPSASVSPPHRKWPSPT